MQGGQKRSMRRHHVVLRKEAFIDVLGLGDFFLPVRTGP